MRQRTVKRRFRRMPEPVRGVLILGRVVSVVGFVVLAAILFPLSVNQERGNGTQQEKTFVQKDESAVPFALRNADAGSLQRVTITDLPEGEASLEARRAWVGITFPEAQFLKGVYARGIVTGEIEGPADYWEVEATVALQLLRAKDPHAAEWFAARVFSEQFLLFRVP